MFIQIFHFLICYTLLLSNLSIFHLIRKAFITDIVSLVAKPPVKSPSAPPAKAAPSPNRGKNQFFLAKWFGFGNKWEPIYIFVIVIFI